MDAWASLSPGALHYYVEDDSFPHEWDAYLVDLPLEEGQPNTMCVVLFPGDSSLPEHLYVPRGIGGAQGVPYEQVLYAALQAYKSLHRSRIAAGSTRAIHDDAPKNEADHS